MNSDTITILGMESDAASLLRNRARDTPGGVVIDATNSAALNTWHDVETALAQSFAALREAKKRDVNLVAIVRTDDEYGRQGALPAMFACALTSAVRTLALEARDLTMMANVVAADDDGNRDALLRTVCDLLESDSVTGQVIVVGRGHLGKVQP